MAKKKKRYAQPATASTNTDKGRRLEQIVAAMHTQPGVATQTNVRLPPIHNARGQRREIDVLVTATVTGYQVRLAIECKNEATLTGSQALGVFKTKLEYVGIPVRSGIFVSAAGYTRGAREYADEVGIKLLTYENLDEELPLAMRKAVESILYVVCQFQGLEVTTTFPDESALEAAVEAPVSPLHLTVLYKESNGELSSVHIPDLLWVLWTTGEAIPDQLGVHKVPLSVPDGMFWISDGKRYLINNPLYMAVKITGVVFSFEGDVRRHRLVDIRTNAPERELTDVHIGFDPNTPITVRTIKTEKEFDELHQAEESIHLAVERFRMPRIIYWNAYWPRSQRAIENILAIDEANRDSDMSPLDLINFNEVEGEGASGIAAAWDPIDPRWRLYSRFIKDVANE